jgi:hypothetical protein
LFTTSIDWPVTVNVWGDEAEMFETERVPPVWMATVDGVKKKSDCVTEPPEGGGVWLGVGLAGGDVWEGDGVGVGLGEGEGEGLGLG